MIQVSACMVCERVTTDYINEISTKSICWETHPLPIFTYCKYNQICNRIINDTLKKMTDEYNLLPTQWILNNYLSSITTQYSYTELYDKMYGLAYETLEIPRSSGSTSTGKLYSQGEKYLSIKDNELWIVAEFTDSGKPYFKKVHFKTLLKINPDSIILNILNDYVSQFSDFYKLKESLKPN